MQYMYMQYIYIYVCVCAYTALSRGSPSAAPAVLHQDDVETTKATAKTATPAADVAANGGVVAGCFGCELRLSVSVFILGLSAPLILN